MCFVVARRSTELKPTSDRPLSFFLPVVRAGAPFALSSFRAQAFLRACLAWTVSHATSLQSWLISRKNAMRFPSHLSPEDVDFCVLLPFSSAFPECACHSVHPTGMNPRMRSIPATADLPVSSSSYPCSLDSQSPMPPLIIFDTVGSIATKQPCYGRMEGIRN